MQKLRVSSFKKLKYNSFILFSFNTISLPYKSIPTKLSAYAENTSISFHTKTLLNSKETGAFVFHLCLLYTWFYWFLVSSCLRRKFFFQNGSVKTNIMPRSGLVHGIGSETRASMWPKKCVDMYSIPPKIVTQVRLPGKMPRLRN
jgi:hypothetical protein